jgi:6-phosphogluconolactonase
MKSEIKIFPDLTALSSAAAELFVEIGKQAIEKNGRFTVALSGGSTPKLLFQTLSGADFRAQINRARTFFFFGDERHAPPDSKESNYRMALENLFEPFLIQPQNVFRWRGEWKNTDKIAADYEKVLIDFFQTESPRFDLILLGMGADGHTASLFPETAALGETKKLAVANWVEKLNASRLTFTLPLINNAANIAFLIGGAEKAETLKTVLEGEFEPIKFPSQSIKPTDGKLFWYTDSDAAQLIKND